MKERVYVSIDLKSFYASVECVERGLEPLDVNLVVADASRTDKTICLAVSPALKSFKVPGRPRLFEVIAKVNALNRTRVQGFTAESLKDICQYNEKYYEYHAANFIMSRKERAQTDSIARRKEDSTILELEKSLSLEELKKDAYRKIAFLIAKPRMSLYVDYSMRIYDIYLKYISPEDIFVYSIDEVFIELTPYLKTYDLTARELVQKILMDIYTQTKITATAGIGTNLYLAKVAMDIVAKKSKADERGARIAFLDIYKFRTTLWNHLPLTDFWGIGKGTAKKLNEHGLYTIGDIARCSIGGEKEYYNANLLYRLFGVNAESLMDHAWGIEPVQIRDVKDYTPSVKSLSSTQVLSEPYTFDAARIIIMEMAEKMAFGLTEKKYKTSMIVVRIGYDVGNVKENYKKEMEEDCYGRKQPKHAYGSLHIEPPTNLTSDLLQKAVEVFERIVDKNLWIRRIGIVAAKLEVFSDRREEDGKTPFQNYFDMASEESKKGQADRQREEKLQNAILNIKKRYGKNAILRGYSFQKGATARERNRQIGGHRE